MEGIEDGLSAVLTTARQQLQDFRVSLDHATNGYSAMLGQLSHAASRLQEETEELEPPAPSAVLPLATVRKKKSQIQKPLPDSPPRDRRPYRLNHASKLKKKHTPAAVRQRTAPVLKAADKFRSAADLMAAGVVQRHDDLSALIPAIEGNARPAFVPLFANLHIDIQGAAIALRARQAEWEAEEEYAEPEIEAPPVYAPEPKQEVQVQEEELPAPAPAPEVRRARVYEELQDEYAFQTLLVVRGVIARGTPDFESFQRTNHRRWESIDEVLNGIERFCQKSGLMFAEINGRALAEAARSQVLSEDVIVSCLQGIEEFLEKRRNTEAMRIQRNWRIYLDKLDVKRRRREFRAAYAIQEFWRWKLKGILLKAEISEKLETVVVRAAELANTLSGIMSEIESDPHVLVHVVESPQDLTRCFDLMYRNAIVILILYAFPVSHIWEEFIEVLAHGGISDPHERMHFILLREGESVLPKLKSDMKSIHQVRRLICGRPAMIIPHSDWTLEASVSVDIQLPIMGCLNKELEARAVFQEAAVISTFATKPHTLLASLISEGLDVLRENRDIKRWIIRFLHRSDETSLAWFDVTPEFFRWTSDLGALFRQALHTVGYSGQGFLGAIGQFSARMEAVPENVRGFPTVSLFLTGTEIRVFGTFDRIHFAPFRFSANLIPAISAEASDLIRMARQVGSCLMKKGVLGYVMVDFMSFVEEGQIRTVGFDIRLNAYPDVLTIAYMNLCCGYDPMNNRMLMINSVQSDIRRQRRFAVVQTELTHAAFAIVGSGELKKAAYGQGLMFDLLNRTGFRLVFYDSPCEGKGFAIAAGQTAEAALFAMEKGYGFLLKFLGQRVASESNSSIAQAVLGMCHFRSRTMNKG